MNYLRTRANALEGAVRLHFVKNGCWKQIASFPGPASAHMRHDDRVAADSAIDFDDLTVTPRR